MPPVAVVPLPYAISDLFAQTTSTGKITLADRYGMLAVLLQDSLNEEEICCINRLLYALRRGRIQIVDELSAIEN
jgi:hypothetical protein